MIELTDDNFNEAREAEFAVVEFGATWCGACRKLLPVLEEIEKDFETVLFAHVDIEKGKELVKEFSISGLPTTLLMRNGEIYQRFTGLHPKSKIRVTIEAMMS